VGKNAFALRVRGDSMEPKFQDGCIIIVDPDKESYNGAFVVVRESDTDEATFKQLQIDGSRRYLKPVNPRYPIMEMRSETLICGVVVKMEMDV
jgi:SOS-response transcriptional repressor LexA